MLKTDRCILTELQQQDYDDAKALYLDAEARRYLGGPVDEQMLMAKFTAKLSSNTGSYWVIRHAHDGEFIGEVSLALHHDGTSTEVSYQLLPEWWGQGYATEVVKRVIQYAFEELGLPRVIAETQTANKASCRVLEKVGMQLQQTVERFGAEQAIFSVASPDPSVS